MVKSLHPINEIASSISLADDRRVRLAHEAGADSTLDTAAGDTTNVSDEAPLDPVAAVIRALQAPVDFPPLSAGTVPGDRVAIAVDENVPCVGRIVRGAVEALERAGIDAEAISIVTTDREISQLCRDELSGHMAPMPQFVVHDPDDADNLCLVGVTKRREPLVVNRMIFDADIVLPIGCARVNGKGAYESLFPRFSNAESIARSRTPAAIASAESVAQRTREADEAGWLIGVLMVVEVIPGAGETVAAVVAGEPQAVARRGEELSRRNWLLHSPQQVGLVIATITGGAPSQNWTNVGRALETADTLLSDGGAVAVCTNLDKPPGESLGRLIGSSDLAKTERKLLNDRRADSWPAWQLARALERGPVYFLSQLPAETVEDMGLAPVADVNELARLAGRHEDFVLIEDSQHAVVTVDSDENG